MIRQKKKYYQLDDLHDLVSVKESNKNSEIEKLTSQFFAKRRKTKKSKLRKTTSV